jgi:uncharacterized protein
VGLAVLGWLVASLIGSAGATILLAAAGHRRTDPDLLPFWLLAVEQLPLYVALIGATVVISRQWGTGRVRDDYGIRFRLVDLWGLVIGVVMQLVFLPVVYKILSVVIDTSSLDKPAKKFTDRANGSVGVALLILVIVIGAPVAEEIFFRGLVMRSIAARYSDAIALVGSAVMFALVHLQPLQFAGLALFGMVLAYCAQRTGRLGMGIAAHMSFNATTVVVLLARR